MFKRSDASRDSGGGVDMAATKQLDLGQQQIVNQVRAQVEYHLERQRDAGRTPDEIAQDRAALVAGIVEALRVEYLANRARTQP